MLPDHPMQPDVVPLTGAVDVNDIVSAVNEFEPLNPTIVKLSSMILDPIPEIITIHPNVIGGLQPKSEDWFKKLESYVYDRFNEVGPSYGLGGEQALTTNAVAWHVSFQE